jgi:hypothetical protein
VTGLVIAGLAVSAPAQATMVPDATVVPNSATGCTGITCIFVNGTGLHVNYATVTNRSSGTTGQCTISDTSDGRTFFGPTCPPGHTWRLNFNRNLRNQSKVCGSISGRDVACVTIHN